MGLHSSDNESVANNSSLREEQKPPNLCLVICHNQTDIFTITMLVEMMTEVMMMMMMMMMIMMMAVIAAIKYFRLMLAHQRVHFILLQLNEGEERRRRRRGRRGGRRGGSRIWWRNGSSCCNIK